MPLSSRRRHSNGEPHQNKKSIWPHEFSTGEPVQIHTTMPARGIKSRVSRSPAFMPRKADINLRLSAVPNPRPRRSGKTPVPPKRRIEKPGNPPRHGISHLLRHPATSALVSSRLAEGDPPRHTAESFSLAFSFLCLG